ncbi:DNA polymerase III [Pseudomonas syringae pv. actinidiae]|uniref:DNA polymerase III n=1 Tax=Pseudomonas syringae pv. actinidiae TaxID=103796 RepID=A0AAN4TQG3_PSESF|nr:DNA polymerase III [Pseudomonas syringae pv. actinidiae]
MGLSRPLRSISGYADLEMLCYNKFRLSNAFLPSDPPFHDQPSFPTPSSSHNALPAGQQRGLRKRFRTGRACSVHDKSCGSAASARTSRFRYQCRFSPAIDGVADSGKHQLA